MILTRIGFSGNVEMKRTYKVAGKFDVLVQSEFAAYMHITPKGRVVEVLEATRNMSFFLIDNDDNTAVNLDDLNNFIDDEAEKLNLSENCHGYSFMGGGVLIDNSQVPTILNDLYEETNGTSDYNIVVLFNNENEEFEHSILFEDGLFKDKQGIRSRKESKSLDEILNTKPYNKLVPKFYKKLAS